MDTQLLWDTPLLDLIHAPLATAFSYGIALLPACISTHWGPATRVQSSAPVMGTPYPPPPR
ncbi:unnamed protein product [Eretmochelys imbricata]